jgi:hypothetical protein
MVDMRAPPPVKGDGRDLRVSGTASTGPKDSSVTKFEVLDNNLDILIEDRRELRQACRLSTQPIGCD